jgi:ABC-2 type transport system permease protein
MTKTTETLTIGSAQQRQQVSRARPLLALTRAEARLFLRDPLTTLLGVLLPAAVLAGLGAVPALREPSEVFGGVRFVDFLAPSLLAISIAVLGVQNLPTGLATYREKGILRRLSATPVSPFAVLIVQLVLNLVTVALGTVLMVAVAVGVFGVAAPRHPLGFALAFVCGTAAVFAIGLLIAAVAPRSRVAAGIGTIVSMVTQFFAGVYLPKFLLPEVIVRVGEFVPPGIGAFQGAWTGDGADPAQLAVMALIAIMATGLAARFFRWE